MGGIDRFFLGGEPLPSMPEVARQLVASFDDEKVDLKTIAKLTAREQTLARKVLRLVNARYTKSQATTTFDAAAGVLGMERLRNFVLAASIASAFPQVEGFDRIAFWKHAIATAGYAQWFARILGGDADSAYLAGFLLRSGQLLMARVVPQAMAQVEETCQAPGMRLHAELRLLGCHHGQVTAELARRWRLPQRFVNGFAHAAAPLEARPFSLLAAVLQMSSVLADAGSLHLGIQEALDEVDPPLLQHLRLDVPWLRTTAPGYEDLTGPVEELLET